jgi:hypothetical protein
MELDNAFKFALVLAWEDLQEISKPPSVRLEYDQEAGIPLDHLIVWADRPKGYQFLVCNYWTTATLAHPSGARFANGYHSEKLAQSLEFIMKNQDQFTRPADAGSSGLVLIYPPAEKDRADAAAWMSGIHGRATNHGGAAAEAGAALSAAR